MEPILGALLGATGSTLITLVYTVTAEWRRRRQAAGERAEASDADEGLAAISARLAEMQDELAAAQRDAQKMASELEIERRRREAS